MKSLPVLAVLAAASMASAAAADTPPPFGAANASPAAAVGGGQPKTDPNGVQNAFQSWNTTPPPGGSLTASGSFERGGVRITSTSTATWAPDLQSGTVEFNGLMTITDTDGLSLLAQFSQDDIMQDGFTATADGQFNLNYDITGQHDFSGHGQWDLVATDLTDDTIHSYRLGDSFTDTINETSGLQSVALTAGHIYFFQLQDAETFTVSHNSLGDTSNFSWTIDSNAPAGVPEPAAWALMILGFGGIGTVLRRRRTAAFA